MFFVVFFGDKTILSLIKGEKEMAKEEKKESRDAKKNEKARLLIFIDNAILNLNELEGEEHHALTLDTLEALIDELKRKIKLERELSKPLP